MPGTTRPRSVLALLGFCAVTIAVAAVAGTLTVPEIPSWYHRLHHPPLSPPDWLFAPVWTLLYLLIALSAWLAWRTRDSTCRSNGLRMWGVQLVINFAWTGVFFRMHSPGVALIDLALLILAIVLTIRPFRVIRPLAAWLLAPYLAWTVFAFYLDAGIVYLNR